MRSGRLLPVDRDAALRTAARIRNGCGARIVYAGVYFFAPATIFRHSSKVSSAALAPLGRR